MNSASELPALRQFFVLGALRKSHLHHDRFDGQVISGHRTNLPVVRCACAVLPNILFGRVGERVAILSNRKKFLGGFGRTEST